MTKRIVTNRQKKIYQIISSFFEWADEPTGELVNFLRSEGYTNSEIAKAMGVSPSQISKKWPIK